MADLNKPNQNANRSKAEGERWSSDPDTVEKAEHETPAENYPPDEVGNAGGITNRPLDEEVDNQVALPARGRSRNDRGDSSAGLASEMDGEAARSER